MRFLVSLPWLSKYLSQKKIWNFFCPTLDLNHAYSIWDGKYKYNFAAAFWIIMNFFQRKFNFSLKTAVRVAISQKGRVKSFFINTSISSILHPSSWAIQQFLRNRVYTFLHAVANINYLPPISILITDIAVLRNLAK